MKYRSEVHLNLFSNYSKTLIQTLLSRLEDSSNRKTCKLIDNMTFSVAPNNEVVAVMGKASIPNAYYSNTEYDFSHSSLVSMSENDVRILIADLIKRYVIRHYQSSYWNDSLDYEWKRSNTKAITIGKTQTCIADIYFIYDYLKGRKNLSKKYSSDKIDTIVGHEADIITAELEASRRAALDEARKKYQSDVTNTVNRYNKIRSDAYSDEKKEKILLEENYKARIAEINKEFGIEHPESEVA